MIFLITGASGFIGFSVAKQLLELGHDVVGIDNHNDYYDVNLKLARLEILKRYGKYRFHLIDITDGDKLLTLFSVNQFDRVFHFAAQAGVRHSIDAPMSYGQNNLMGFLNILEACRQYSIAHLIYASSSSVYGLNRKTPFSTSDAVDHPVSLYAATKRSNELMAHSYSHLYGLPTTGLRFFTVYGPWGRPDMAPFLFTNKILQQKPISINNHGDMWRDFTYIDDIVNGVIGVSNAIPSALPESEDTKLSPELSTAPYRIFNIGHGSPVNLMRFIEQIETATGVSAIKQFREMQAGDVYQTYADTQDLFDAISYRPQVNIEQGVQSFVDWYQHFYEVN
ncbi:NAD-dependent epimerase/dehydratase family protein [Vibrio kyushuensis]|uniref:NAD-dependent epimerase/dehydratase family protein n=1 Tax=Vibrio kyushuensis TaxID=2910249 RepID=UPI003D13A087